MNNNTNKITLNNTLLTNFISSISDQILTNMKQTLSSLLMLLFLQPAMAQRKINKVPNQDPLQIVTVKVSGGSFDLGSDDDGTDRKPAHTVTLSDYNMGAYEVTQAQWKAVMGTNPSMYDCAECPVTYVSWDDIQAYLAKLNSTGSKHYRLPTEAEWEYAARGGNNEHLTRKRDEVARGGVNGLLIADNSQRVPEKELSGDKYSGKKNAPQTVAWFDRNSEDHVHPIGRKKANDLGIYDMSGNAEEWCSDFYAGTYGSKNTVENPKGPNGGKSHVVRGGSWASNKDEISVTRRAAYLPDTKTNSLGFRVVEDTK